MILSYYFIKKKIAELAAAHKRTRKFKTIQEVERVLLFYSLSDSDAVEHCIDKLKEMGKQVLACTYTASAVTPPKDESYFFVEAKKDLDYWAFPSSTLINTLNAFNPDIIIDLSEANCYVMQYLLLQCTCNFKTGIKRSKQDLYDFSILETERMHIDYFFEQIIFYLQTIRSK